MRHVAPLTLALATLASGCMAPGAGVEEISPLALQQEKPQLALLDHILGEYFSADLAAPLTVCAAMSDGRSAEALPPMDEVALMARFEQLAPMARCTQDGAGWKDADTGEPALLFEIRSLSCASAALCSATAGYTAGPQASEYRQYRMTFDRRWIVSEG